MRKAASAKPASHEPGPGSPDHRCEEMPPVDARLILGAWAGRLAIVRLECALPLTGIPHGGEFLPPNHRRHARAEGGTEHFGTASMGPEVGQSPNAGGDAT
jgi:hypothetical protein